MQKKSEKTIKNNDNRMIMGLVLMCLMLAMGIFVAVVALNQKEREITRLEEEIGRYASQAYPIVVPIPSVHGGNGYGAELLRRQSERALGMDILFRGEQGAGDRPDGEDNAR